MNSPSLVDGCHQLAMLGRFLARRSWITLCTGIVLFVVVKNGVRYSGWEGSINEALLAFPDAVNYNSSALLVMLVASFVPVEQRASSVLTLIPQVMTLVLVLILTARRIGVGHGGRLKARQLAALVAVAASPIVTLLLGNIGFGRDWLPVLWLAVMVLAKNVGWSAFCVMLAAFSNPEQTVVAVAIILIAVQSSSLVSWRRRARLWAILATAVALPIFVWQFLSGEESRLLFLLNNLESTSRSFVGDPYISVYAGLSASWVIVILWSLLERPYGRVWPTWLALGLGFLSMAVTTDGTRVFSIILTPLILILIVQLTSPSTAELASARSDDYSAMLAIIVILSLMMPAVTWAGSAGLPATSSAASLVDTIHRLTSELP